MEGMEYFNLKKSVLVTAERDEVVQTESGEVVVIPMWKWLLS